jgi:protein phosphatase
VAELRWGTATHEGQLRAQNEDNLHADGGLFVVADGMGGHLAGEVASEIAVTRLRENLSADGTTSLDMVVGAVDQANQEIYAGSTGRADQAGMGTTVTAIAVVEDPHDGEVFAIANVGDSRCYVLRHSRLRQLTIDHSFVQELVAEGAISRDEARTHPRRNIVTRALGIEPTVRVDSWTMPIFQGDRLLLCSDGLVDEVIDDEITRILVEHTDPDGAAQALVDAANAAGGRDNITVVIVDVLEGDDPPDPTEEFDVVPLWSDDRLDSTGEVQIVADPLPDDTDSTVETDEPAAATVDDGEAAASAAVPAPADTEAVPVLPEPEPQPAPPTGRRGKRTKRAGLFRFLLIVGVAAVVVLAAAIVAAWARSGYYVAFDEDDRVVIYQGREGGFLWFEPTAEAYGQYTRDELTEESVALVEDQVHFESQESAARFVAERLHPIDEEPSDAPIDDERDEPAPADTLPPTDPPVGSEP